MGRNAEPYTSRAAGDYIDLWSFLENASPRCKVLSEWRFPTLSLKSGISVLGSKLFPVIKWAIFGNRCLISKYQYESLCRFSLMLIAYGDSLWRANHITWKSPKWWRSDDVNLRMCGFEVNSVHGSMHWNREKNDFFNAPLDHYKNAEEKLISGSWIRVWCGSRSHALL